MLVDKLYVRLGACDLCRASELDPKCLTVRSYGARKDNYTGNKKRGFIGYPMTFRLKCTLKSNSLTKR